MLLLAAIIAASAPVNQPSGAGAHGATARARAVVRIVSAVRLSLDGRPNPEAPPAREAIVHTEGTKFRAKLIEFQ